VDRSFNFTIVGSAAAATFGIKGGVHFDNAPFSVFHHICAGNVAGIPEAHFLSRSEPEVFLWRLFHEVLALDEYFARQGHVPAAASRVGGMIGTRKPFRLPFREVDNDHFERIKNCHAPIRTFFKILPDTKLQQRQI